MWHFLVSPLFCPIQWWNTAGPNCSKLVTNSQKRIFHVFCLCLSCPWLRWDILSVTGVTRGSPGLSRTNTYLAMLKMSPNVQIAKDKTHFYQSSWPTNILWAFKLFVLICKVSSPNLWSWWWTRGRGGHHHITASGQLLLSMRGSHVHFLWNQWWSALR
jgi:hypothetical protein